MSYIQTETLLAAFELVVLAAFLIATFLIRAEHWQVLHSCLRSASSRLQLDGNPLAGAVVTVGLVALLVDVGFGLLVAFPAANYHDEFSYLLSGDTFSRGRLSNPTPPNWEHFESFHILARPTYQSKYPPGQGLMLAFGLSVGGFAGFGVWVSHALAAMAICWCLGQFVSSRWAFFGALAFALHDRVVIWWGQTFWGGALPALGGALLFGGYRGWYCNRPWGGLVMGCGAGVLALTRPVEGLVCCAVVLVGIAAGVVRGRRVSGAVLGGAIGLAPALAFLAMCNDAVTGSLFRFPYQEWSQQYQIGLQGATESLELGDVSPFAQTQHEFFAGQHYRFQSQFALWKLTHRLRPFYLPSLALLALLGVRRPRSLSAGVLAAAVLVLLSFVLLNPAGGFPHYLAPAAAPITLGVVQGLRRAARRFARQRGVALVALAALLLVSGGRLIWSWPTADLFTGQTVEESKAVIEAELASRGRDALVLVRYGAGHLPAVEFVYNGAELTSSSEQGGPRVVWARSLGEVRDRELIAAFGNRAPFVYHLDSQGGLLIEFHEYARNNPGYLGL